MSLTKDIHTYFLKTTLDFCDKEKIEFRDFLSERLLDEDDSYEWDGSMWVSPDPPQKPHIPKTGNLFWEYLQFYYEQSENAVTPRSADWSTEDWNKAANEIYRYKFLSSVARAEEWVALFNSSQRAAILEAMTVAAEARAVAAEARAVAAEARAVAAETRALDAEINTRALLRCEEEWSSTRATLIEEVLCDLHAIGESSK